MWPNWGEPERTAYVTWQFWLYVYICIYLKYTFFTHCNPDHHWVLYVISHSIVSLYPRYVVIKRTLCFYFILYSISQMLVGPSASQERKEIGFVSQNLSQTIMLVQNHFDFLHQLNGRHSLWITIVIKPLHFSKTKKVTYPRRLFPVAVSLKWPDILPTALGNKQIF